MQAGKAGCIYGGGIVKCFYASSGLNYKNGWVTTCPRQSDMLGMQATPSMLFRSKKFQELRDTLDRDEWPKGCHLCQESEEIGHPSMRQDHKWVDENLRHVELRFSNACNMACLHCSEVFSSGWEKVLSGYKSEVAETFELENLTRKMHRHGKGDNHKMQINMNEVVLICRDLIDNFPHLQMVDFAGGEVLFQKQFYPCLEMLAEHRNRLKISFHTNFNAPFDVRELHAHLSPFKSIMTISLDCSKEMYPYFRDGNWDKMEKNLKQFRELPEIDCYIQPSCTTSAYQMMDFAQIWDDFLSLEPLVDGYDASIVQTPRYLDPAVMMHEWEHTIEAGINMAKVYARGNRSATKWINYISDYVLNKKTPYNDYYRFLHYISETDTLFGKDFNDAFDIFRYDPEEKELYTNDCRLS